jgi:tetratricopeptide (TPR) repeat protein
MTGGVWLLLYLSKNPRQPLPTTEKPSAVKPAIEQNAVVQPEPPLPSAGDSAQLALDKGKTEQKLADFLEAKNGLDQMGAQEWGSEAYTRMIQLGREADSHFMAHEFGTAAERYELATAIAAELAESAAGTLRRLLEEGSEALSKGDGEEAQKKFSGALMIDPANPSARHGLKRAETIATVMQLVESGRQHEKSGRFASARSDYRQALQIDPDFSEAQQALSRVTNLIEEEQFKGLMSEGMAAFHNNEYAPARTKLLKAKSIRPDSREVSDALNQVDQAMRLARMDTLRKEAQTAEAEEDWKAALTSYLAVLDIDKNLQFAAQGKQRAMEQIQIDRRLQFFLSKPQVLESDNQLNNALRLLAEAGEAEPQGPKRKARIEELEGLVAIAQKTVKVIIASDNLTRVAVYKVGKLGQFTSYELELRPGTYTVVGARDGYKDVRQKIIVKPGQQELQVTIKCRIKI